jgi:hypothetical protein
MPASPMPPVRPRVRLLDQPIGQRCQVVGEAALEGPPTASHVLASACALVVTPHLAERYFQICLMPSSGCCIP